MENHVVGTAYVRPRYHNVFKEHEFAPIKYYECVKENRINYLGNPPTLKLKGIVAISHSNLMYAH